MQVSVCFCLAVTQVQGFYRCTCKRFNYRDANLNKTGFQMNYGGA